MKKIVFFLGLLLFPTLVFASSNDLIEEKYRSRLSDIVQGTYKQCNRDRFAMNESGYYPVDVLLGTGRSSHYGNKLLRQVVEKSLYTFSLHEKSKQLLIAEYIYEELSEQYGVDFLKFDGTIWKHVSEEDSVDRVMKSFQIMLKTRY